MKREEFLRELEYLLQDIPETEREDALGYYRDYLEEAGPENEEQAIREFGSPERVAAIIRSDMQGSLAGGGEFTERGYEDERFRDPNYQVAKRYDLPEETEAPNRGTENGKAERSGPRTSRALKLILWVVLIITAAPVALGIGGGLAGIAGGILGILVGLTVAVGAVTIALLAAGVILFGVGIVHVVIHPLNGILLLGIAMVLLGLGILALLVSAVFYGRFLPFLLRSVIDVAGGLLNRRRNRA